MRACETTDFVAATAAVGTPLIAGCSGETDGSGDDSTEVGSFRLLISDQPAAIDDFDSLNVSFARARIFQRTAAETDEDEDVDSGDTTPTNDTVANDTGTNDTAVSDGAERPANDTTFGSEGAGNKDDTAENESDTERDEQERDDERGFSEMSLSGRTVDLTEVVGEKAARVLNVELQAGMYSKIELYVTEVIGTVGGDAVAVTVPSEKLQIAKRFTVAADESTSFVFDIGVVKKGPNGYNLLPVIAKSGVAGRMSRPRRPRTTRRTASDDQQEPPADNSTSEQEQYPVSQPAVAAVVGLATGGRWAWIQRAGWRLRSHGPARV